MRARRHSGGMPRPLPGEDARLTIPLRETEYLELQALSRRTSREAAQFTQWLIRLAIARQLHLAVNELEVAATEPTAAA